MAKLTEAKITNRSKQVISLNVKPKGGDFYINTQDIRLSPFGSKGNSVIIPISYVNMSQLENLAAKGMISFVLS